MTFTLEQIKDAVKAKGYKWFESGIFNLNIVGIRNSETGSEITNKFDDLITVSYKTDKDTWVYWEADCTTDPGKHWAENLFNPNGVAILVPGQYRKSHTIGKHKGKYLALKQCGKVKVYRDDNRNANYDLNPRSIQEGLFGINIHRASATGTSKQINKWSAGCQVIADNIKFDEFMSLAEEAAEHWGDLFTYTLIESKDVKDETV